VAIPVADKNSTHLAGEYFVAAELYRRGYSVAMTLGNAKAIDLFAEHEARTVNVQVKAIRGKKSIGWPLMKAGVVDGVMYVLVTRVPPFDEQPPKSKESRLALDTPEPAAR
jgi:hypothetical protein